VVAKSRAVLFLKQNLFRKSYGERNFFAFLLSARGLCVGIQGNIASSEGLDPRDDIKPIWCGCSLLVTKLLT